MQEFNEMCLLFNKIGVDYEVNYGTHWRPGGRNTISVAQAHFKFNPDGIFVQVEDGEMGGVYLRRISHSTPGSAK